MLSFGDGEGVKDPGVEVLGVTDSSLMLCLSSCAPKMMVNTSKEASYVAVCTDVVEPNTVTRTHRWK